MSTSEVKILQLDTGYELISLQQYIDIQNYNGNSSTF